MKYGHGQVKVAEGYIINMSNNVGLLSYTFLGIQILNINSYFSDFKQRVVVIYLYIYLIIYFAAVTSKFRRPLCLFRCSAVSCGVPW